MTEPGQRLNGSATRLRCMRLFGAEHSADMERVQPRSTGLRSALGAVIRQAESFADAPTLTVSRLNSGADAPDPRLRRLEMVDEDRFGPELTRRFEAYTVKLFVGGGDWLSAMEIEVEVVGAEERTVRVPSGSMSGGAVSISIADNRPYNEQVRRLRTVLSDIANNASGFNTFALAGGRIDLRFGIVLFVIGTDRATWHTTSPNRSNVAITRARRRLVIIGDHHRITQSRCGPLAALAAEIPVQRRWGPV